jgi:hypothetical protein
MLGWDLWASEAALSGVKSNNNIKYPEIYKSRVIVSPEFD